MLPTTLAMTPSHRFRLASSDKAHRAAEAAALELLAHSDPELIADGAEVYASQAGIATLFPLVP
jgi:hypothetical protein